MCLVKTPKITPQATAQEAEKKINYFSNDYFGSRSSSSTLNRLGRNSLRINRSSGSPTPNRAANPVSTPNPAPTAPPAVGLNPALKIGGGGGARREPYTRTDLR